MEAIAPWRGRIADGELDGHFLARRVFFNEKAAPWAAFLIV